MDRVKIYQKLKEKRDEMNELPMNDFGRYSLAYREIASYFKVAPWRAGMVLAIAGTIFLLYLLGPSFLKLASLLAKGF